MEVALCTVEWHFYLMAGSSVIAQYKTHEQGKYFSKGQMGASVISHSGKLQ